MSTISENDANLVKNIDDAVNTGKDPAKPSVVNPSDESSDFPEKKKISPITNKDSANRCPRNILVIVSSIGLIFLIEKEGGVISSSRDLCLDDSMNLQTKSLQQKQSS